MQSHSPYLVCLGRSRSILGLFDKKDKEDMSEEHMVPPNNSVWAWSEKGLQEAEKDEKKQSILTHKLHMSRYIAFH